MRNQEEVELAVLDLRLFHKARVNVGALRRILDEFAAVLRLSLLEESLTDSLVHNDQGDLGRLDLWKFYFFSFLLVLTSRLLFLCRQFGLLEEAVLFSYNLVKLVQLFVNDHLSHGVANAITVDEDVFRHRAVEITIALECALEVVRQHARRYDLLALLWLWRRLSVVLAEEGVVRRTETNRTLLTFVAHIDAHEHGGLRDLRAKAHTPEVTTDLGVHLTNNIHEDAVIVLRDRAIRHELRDDGGLAVDLVLQERVEVLMVRVIWHDDKEDEAGLCASGNVRLDATVVVELDRLREGFQELILVLCSPVLDQADIRVLDEDVESLLDAHVVELLVDVARVLLITLEAEDGEVFEGLRLMHHRVEAVRVLKRARGHLFARVAPHLSFLLLARIGRLLLEVRRFKNLWTLQHACFDRIRGQLDLEAPLFNLLRRGNHGIKIADRFDAVMRFLEETLTHGCHDAFVFTYALRDSNECAQFGRQIDILSFLLDLEERLIQVHDGNIVLLLEVQHHRDGLTNLTLLELTRLWSHVPFERGNLVGFVLAVARHDNCTFEFFVDRLRDFFLIWRFSHEPLALFFETLDLLLDELEAVVNGEVLADVVYN